MMKLYECESEFERNKLRDLMLDEMYEKICKIEKILESCKSILENEIQIDK